MRKIKYIMLFILSVSLFNSCIDDTTNYDLNDNGPNVAGFEINKASVTAVADGAEYSFKFKVKIVGPTSMNLTDDITLTIGADATSTAVENVNYKIPNPVIVLKKSNNYLGWFEITMVTADIETPYEGDFPVLVLKPTAATGSSKVLPNGKSLQVTLNYACFSNLAGTYSCHAVITRAVSGAVTTYDWTDDIITEIRVGTYRTTYVTYKGYVPLGTGTNGYTFMDNCNKLTVPEQNLLDYYSNIVIGTAVGSHDNATDKLHIEYSTSTTAAAGNRLGVYDYTPVVK